MENSLGSFGYGTTVYKTIGNLLGCILNEGLTVYSLQCLTSP